jgi:hypothetical protein
MVGPFRAERALLVTAQSQAVADAEDGFDDGGGVGAEFAAQVLDVGVDGAFVAGELVAADPVDQLVAGVDMASAPEPVVCVVYPARSR